MHSLRSISIYFDVSVCFCDVFDIDVHHTLLCVLCWIVEVVKPECHAPHWRGVGYSMQCFRIVAFSQHRYVFRIMSFACLLMVKLTSRLFVLVVSFFFPGQTWNDSYVWALVHSRDKSDVRRGLELISALVSTENADMRELKYLKAVGEFRLQRPLAARQTLKETLAQYPDFRQASSLLDSVENELVKDGLVGLGAGAAVIGVIAAVVAATSRR